MIDRILVPLDGSKRAESALGAACAIARPVGGTILVFHALTRLPAGGFVRAERERATSYLRGIVRRLKARGLRAEVRLVRGEASGQIERAAREAKIDLVLLSGRGQGGTGTGPLGSVAERVLRTCPVPVLLLRGTTRIRRVLVPLEGTPEAVRVLATVGEAARPLHATVALLQRGGRRGPALARAVDVLARLGIPCRIYRRTGRSPQTIEEVACEMGADLVALASIPVGQEDLGGEVEELLRHSERPLLLVRPAV